MCAIISKKQEEHHSNHSFEEEYCKFLEKYKFSKTPNKSGDNWFDKDCRFRMFR